jgi:hypothetical protein
MKYFKILKVLWIPLMFFVTTLRAQSIQVELMASNVSWDQGEYVGYGFMNLIIPTANGALREDYFGFFPKPGGTKGFIGGPGIAEPAYQKKPTRFPRITVSIRKKITLDQYKAIIRMTNDWNAKNYDLTNQSCIDFVASVAKEVNWLIPGRVDLPEAYLNQLKFLKDLKFAIPGKFTGETNMNGKKFQCAIDFRIIADDLKGQWIWIADDSRGLLDRLQIKGDRSISFSVGAAATLMTFNGNFAADLKSISGTFSSTYGNGSWQMKKN